QPAGGKGAGRGQSCFVKKWDLGICHFIGTQHGGFVWWSLEPLILYLFGSR
ncbi:hypothetical protein Csa_003308, partial [Cucumis sativus]